MKIWSSGTLYSFESFVWSDANNKNRTYTITASTTQNAAIFVRKKTAFAAPSAASLIDDLDSAFAARFVGLLIDVDSVPHTQPQTSHFGGSPEKGRIALHLPQDRFMVEALCHCHCDDAITDEDSRAAGRFRVCTMVAGRQGIRCRLLRTANGRNPL